MAIEIRLVYRQSDDTEVADVLYPISAGALTDDEYNAVKQFVAAIAKYEKTVNPSLIFTYLCKLLAEVEQRRAVALTPDEATRVLNTLDDSYGWYDHDATNIAIRAKLDPHKRRKPGVF